MCCDWIGQLVKMRDEGFIDYKIESMQGMVPIEAREIFLGY